jgi:hypothetical protein
MDKDKAATPEGTADDGSFTYGVDEMGRLIINGIPVDHRNERPPMADEEEEKEPVEEPKEEAKEPEPEAAPEPEPEPEPPPTPEKHKYKLKVQGEEIEREYTPEELVARLQMAEDYQKKTTDLAEMRRKIEPFLPIIEKPAFKEWLDERIQSGEIEPPDQPARPNPEDVIGYKLREQEPDFEEIRGAMREWAATLPAYESDILATNHKAFNEAYDRFKTARQARMPQAPPPPPPKVEAKEEPKVDPKVMQKMIEAKEVAKDRAKVEPPGGQPEEAPDPKKEWRRIDRELKKAVRNRVHIVTYNGRQVDPETAWAMHRYSIPE